MTYDARYAKQWHYARSKGILQWQPVDAARARVTQLIADGYTCEALAEACGVSGTAIRSIAGRYAATSNINRRVARRINALTPSRILAAIEDPCTLVPALGAKRRVRALQAIGHTLGDIDAATGARPGLAKYVADRALGMSITFDKHAAIVRAYERLSGTPGASSRARTIGAKQGWVPPLAWDDEDLDDPRAVPANTVQARVNQGRPFAHVVEDVEWLLEHHPLITSTELAERLGYTSKSGIQHALDRGGRPDLLARLARNAEIAA